LAYWPAKRPTRTTGRRRPCTEHQAHLQQHLEPVRDQARLAVAETLRAVATLQQEAPALLRLGHLLLQREDFPGSDQRREHAQFIEHAGEGDRVRIGRLLAGVEAAPAGRAPAFGHGDGL
jgi:hypothetical protein